MRATRTTGRIRALALALSALVLVAVPAGPPGGFPRATAAPLVPGADFTITSTISSSARTATAPALLYPGVTRYLWYSVRNPNPNPITVTSLGISRVQAPAACTAANLDLRNATFTGSFAIPARSTRTVPTPRPISLINLPSVNQDACKSVTFTFTFSGTATYSAAPVKPVQPAKPATRTLLAAAPSTSARGNPVTLTARVTRVTSAAPAGPTGSVRFYVRSTGSTQVLLGTGTLDRTGTARLRTKALPAGTVGLYALYSGSATYAGSTSRVASQRVIAPPAACTATYTTSIIGTPRALTITGTTGNDFIYAVGANYRIKSGKGSDCVVVGDGTNVIYDGSGADVVIAGNGRNTVKLLGSRNVLVLGNGSGNRVTVKGTKIKGTKKRRNSSANRITIGGGDGNRVTVSKGNRNQITIGGGDRNRVTVRKGNGSQITIGAGDRNRVTISKGRKSRIIVGDGYKNRVTVRRGNRSTVIVGDGARNRVILRSSKNRVALGMGRYNSVTVRASSKKRNSCSVPIPPRTWRGSPARFYRDRIRHCRVVTR